MTNLASILSLSLSLVVSIGCASTPAPAVAPATAATPAPATAQAPTCSAGDVLFEVDTTDIAAGPEKNVVFAGGAWRLDRSGGGTATGCLNAGDLATIQRDVASPWTTSPRSGVQCHMAHSPTTFYANGKAVYVDSGCSSPELDATSNHALAEIQTVLAVAEK